MNLLLKIAINLFLISCIFDPADKLFSLKIPLFILCWIIFFLSKKDFNISFNRDLFFFILIILVIPIVSISYYIIINGINDDFGGFSLFKSFILLLLSFILFDKKINLIKDLSNILSILSFTILLTYIYILINPLSFSPIYEFGLKTGIFHIGQRVYTENLKLWSIFYVTSPMILISIAYYFDLSFKRKSFFYKIILLINIFAMFIAGTRNNMLMSVFLPSLLFIIYSKNKNFIILFTVISFLSCLVYFADSIADMISVDEESNKTKISLLSDYYDIFSSNPKVFLFGQGLGSPYEWKSVGRYYFTSELTYFEIFRYFGFLFGMIIIYLMFYPVIYYYKNFKTLEDNHIVIAYFLYLIMTFFNPLFFSSLGMLIFSVVLTNTFLHKSYLKSLK